MSNGGRSADWTAVNTPTVCLEAEKRDGKQYGEARKSTCQARHCSETRLFSAESRTRVEGFCGWTYAVTRVELSRWHLTTTMVTSSSKPTSPQKLAALFKIFVARSSAESEEPSRTTAERRSIPNSSPS